MKIIFKCFKFYLAIFCAAVLLSLPAALFYLIETGEADMFTMVAKIFSGLF